MVGCLRTMDERVIAPILVGRPENALLIQDMQANADVDDEYGTTHARRDAEREKAIDVYDMLSKVPTVTLMPDKKPDNRSLLVAENSQTDEESSEYSSLVP